MATQPEPLAIEEDPHTGPLRRCLVTRETLPRETMLRFVLGPEGQILFDAAATLPGRGMWLSAKADVLDMSVKRGVFARAAKQSVKVPTELRQLVEVSLLARITDLIGLARRGGNAISGFDKAREWVSSGKAGVAVQASDGSVEERARFTGGRNIPAVTALPAAALGRIFGRDSAVHVVIATGRLARMVEIDAARLAGVAGNGTSGQ